MSEEEGVETRAFYLNRSVQNDSSLKISKTSLSQIGKYEYPHLVGK